MHDMQTEIEALRAEIAPARMILAAHVPDSDGLALAVLVERALEAVRESVREHDRDPESDPQPGDWLELDFGPDGRIDVVARDGWNVTLCLNGVDTMVEVGAIAPATWHRRKVTP